MYLGIAIISGPKSVEQAGLYGAAIGYTYVVMINIFSMYLYIKARNRFKHERIRDNGDLAQRLYGDFCGSLMTVLIICTNFVFLTAYVMFIGTQSDQLLCKTLRVTPCGLSYIWSTAFMVGLLPVLYIRSLAGVGYFSMVILCFTLTAFIIIIVTSIKVLQLSPEEANAEYGLELTEEDRNYKKIDLFMVPVFGATMMSMFLNQQQINLYAECDSPEDFFWQACTVVFVIAICFGLPIGFLGYLAFGNSVKSIILYNLPNQDPASICAKFFIILNLLGSYVIISQPIHYAIEKAGWYRRLAGLDDEQKPELDQSEKGKSEGADPDDDADPVKPAENLSGAEGGEEKDEEGNEKEEEDKASKEPEKDVSPCGYEGEQPFTCCSAFVYFGFRTLLVIVISASAYIIPNINILIVLGGSIFGTTLNIILPVLFYNRAYTFTPKNKALEGAEKEASINIDNKS